MIVLFNLKGHMYLGGMWSGVVPRMTTIKTCIFFEIGLHVQIMISIMHSRVNIIGGQGGPFKEHGNLHFVE